MENIIFIAAPAAGKGTQAEHLVKKYNFAHISTGDLLREEVNSGSELGQELQKIMKEGKLVSDEIVTTLLKKKLESDECNNGFILDGYPRNITQAKILDEMLLELNKPIKHVIYLDVDYETAKMRSCGRIQCKNCGKVYNKFISYAMPKKENTCDECGSTLYERQDDNEESFKIRYDTYQENTKPLIEYYKNKNILFTVDSSKSRDEVSKDVENIISK